MYGVTVEAEIRMSSSSLGAASGSGGDSLNGLKFGQKIYFEDVGGGGSAPAVIPPTGSSSSSAEVVVASPVRKGRGALQGGQPPRCQVEGCNVDLTGAKAYYCRHKVCGMHSKAPMVIVAGLEQRFCQQCSRFHQLPEFDQCKRSCRRRLAGHNERRRKPPPGSLVQPRFPQDTNRVGTFLDFSYSRIQDRDVWPAFRLTEHTPSSQATTTGKYLPDLFQGAYDISPTNVVGHAAQTFLQAPSAATIYPGTDFSAGETFAGVSGSGCALSLLSNQPWDPRSRSSSINNLVDENRAHTSQTASHTPVSNQFISNAWGFKDFGDGNGSGSYHLSLHQIHDPAGPQFHAGSRQYMELAQPRGPDSSSHQMNWSL